MRYLPILLILLLPSCMSKKPLEQLQDALEVLSMIETPPADLAPIQATLDAIQKATEEVHAHTTNGDFEMPWESGGLATMLLSGMYFMNRKKNGVAT